jgi:hypothetical protein
MASYAETGLLGGVGQGIAKAGEMFLSDALMQHRETRLAKLQGEQTAAEQTFKAGESKKDRESAEKIAGMRGTSKEAYKLPEQVKLALQSKYKQLETLKAEGAGLKGKELDAHKNDIRKLEEEISVMSGFSKARPAKIIDPNKKEKTADTQSSTTATKRMEGFEDRWFDENIERLDPANAPKQGTPGLLESRKRSYWQEISPDKAKNYIQLIEKYMPKMSPDRQQKAQQTLQNLRAIKG